MSCRMSALVALVLVFSAARGQALTGPPAVTGTLGGSVSVECSYEAEYHDYSKYWCLGAQRFCDKLVETSIPEREVRKGRVTIRDSPRTASFTVVMEGLRPEDAGTYQCGIDRPVLLDVQIPVSVAVLTATTPFQQTTISAKTASSLPTTTPSTSTNTPSITETSGTWSSEWIVLYLLPAGAFLLILLLLAAVFLVRSQRNKKKAFVSSSSPNNGTMQPPDRPPDLMQSPAYSVVKKPPASASATSSATPDMFYAEIRDLEQETAESPGVSYAHIQFKETEQQEDVYINMQVIRKDPTLECEYDTVRV